MHITVGVIAHVDAGKTTFSEGLLYHTSTIREIGRVDHQSSYLDSHHLEKERGITIFSEQAVMDYKGATYYLIDTPGHVDFSPEMERAIMVMDYAIIIVSAVEGIQGHTETVWQLLKKHRIPAFFFINKTDRDGADVDDVLEEIKVNFTVDICFIANSLDKELPLEVIEFIAERDEKLLELYLEETYRKDVWLDYMKNMIRDNKIYICSSGSALMDKGILQFLNNFNRLTATDYSSKQGKFKARVYKIGHDDSGNRISYMKILDGSIQVRDELTYSLGEEKISEKITELRLYNGKKYQTLATAEAGQLVGAMGLSRTRAGQGIGDIAKEPVYNMVPTLRSKVVFDASRDSKEILNAFIILNEEDPSLEVGWEEELQEIQIQVMGPVQLEILKEVIRERFGLTVEFGEPGIIYKETINDVVTGYGHFEPLRHYAEVHLKIEAGERNSGIGFESLCHIDDLNRGYQNLVKQHITEKEHRGLLTGSPLTDLKITLLTGRAHNKHTSGGDFKEATYRALRQGLEKVESVVLEPYYSFKIKVDLNDMGRVLSDVEKASGNFDPSETREKKAVIQGKVPVSTFMNYPTKLAAFTGGKGMINLAFSGYDICHNQEEVIAKSDYDRNADPEYSSSSIFCAKGQGYKVPWYQAEAKMHCD